MKTAFIFPGQGAQSVGMGKDFYDNFDAAKKLFDEADDALGYSIKKMCFEGSEDDLKLTANTQPAILQRGNSYGVELTRHRHTS